MTIGSLIFLAIGTILALLYIIVLLIASPKYAVYIQNLTDKEHIFKPLYVVGFFVLDKTHYKFGLKLDKQRFKECKVIYIIFRCNSFSECEGYITLCSC